MYDGRPDSELSRDQVIERNVHTVEAHFHNENPESINAAIDLYADDIIWEAPLRGIIMTDPAEIKAAYLDMFRSVVYNKMTTLRRFATEEYVFDDQIADVEVVAHHMPNMNYPVGTRLSVRITHVFMMRDGKIRREIAYEGFRIWGSAVDRDSVPDSAVIEVFRPEVFETASA